MYNCVDLTSLDMYNCVDLTRYQFENVATTYIVWNLGLHLGTDIYVSTCVCKLCVT